MTDRHRARSRRTQGALGAVMLALTLAALPALSACSSEADSEKASDQPPVVAPGKPGEEAETLSPEKAREKSGGDTKPSAADFTYATMMIEHHKQAVVMTDLAPERASSAAVRKLASRIGAGQGPEIKAMQGWLKQNRKAKGSPSRGGGHEQHAQHDGNNDHSGHSTGGAHGSGGKHASGGDGGGHAEHEGHAATMPGMATPAQLKQLRAADGKAFDQLFLTLMTTHHRGAITMATKLMEDGNDVRVEEMATDVMAQQRAEITRMGKLH
ncbi:DUF305 domain-containing protein [Streptomyces sp. NBC_01186]|uniref:DUF305 domain-containing protein n=1 Tax=unclassified Streptomyces TaxID=2593676 RepID=UPI002DD806E4|nr:MULTISPECIES: DUF305 domain-containing protein [unclassified Streptomyces]WSB74544.1 DUF305 domain-containing protein [Streptomyces sp. NBC_01775]WSS17072.1 DUF305 domain-containing protein [Streptomyces sp. NBC_01186]